MTREEIRLIFNCWSDSYQLIKRKKQMGEYPLKKDVATFQRFDKQVKRLLVNEDDITVQIIIDKYINKLMNKEIAIKYHYQPKYIVNKLARLFDKYC